MGSVFADTGFWIAYLNPRDALHAKARQLAATHHFERIVTTEMILAEFLNDLGSRGPNLRRAAAEFLTALQGRADVRIIPQTSTQFWAAANVFQQRSDKDWSLTDCASLLVMQENDLRDALTYDHHFEQMGFRALLRSE